MGESIIVPSLTNDMILSTFKYLVDAELRKRAPGALDFRYGCQEGAIAILTSFFGSASDEVAEKAYNSGETWIQVTERIVNEKLSSWADTFDNLTDNNFSIDYEQMVKAVDEAVDEFALENPVLLIDALNKNL